MSYKKLTFWEIFVERSVSTLTCVVQKGGQTGENFPPLTMLCNAHKLHSLLLSLFCSLLLCLFYSAIEGLLHYSRVVPAPGNYCTG